MNRCTIITQLGLCGKKIKQGFKYCDFHINGLYDAEKFIEIADSIIKMKQFLQIHQIPIANNISNTQLKNTVLCFMAIVNGNKKISEEYIFDNIKPLEKGGMGHTSIVKRKKDGKLFVMKKSLHNNSQQIKKQYQILEKIKTLQYRKQTMNHIAPQSIYKDIHNQFFIMTYYKDYKTLHEYIQKKIYLSDKQRKLLILDLLITIDALHQNNIVHCDIKPENIMIGHNKGYLQLKLIDFGLAKTHHTVWEKSLGLGTFLFMPPEMLTAIDMNKKPISLPHPHCFIDYIHYDLWATGLCVLYLLNYQNPIFQNITSLQQLISYYKNRTISQPYIDQLDTFINNYLIQIDQKLSNIHLLSFSPTFSKLIINW